MDRHTGGMHIHWPGNRLPVTVILDDPMPCRNPMWYMHPDDGHVAEVPNSFTERFVDVIARTGAAGKFSVVPCPGGQGRVDEGIPGVEDEDLAHFLRLVRERIAPRWDIGPEMLTHYKALDLATMCPLPEREDAWAAHQDEASLTAYISYALQILRNAGLEPTGVTSPWSFGCEVEEAYATAISTALREVCGVRRGWYFLHCDERAPSVAPRVMRLDPSAGTALVSIVSGCEQDFAWPTQGGEAAALDLLLTADGTGGRLAKLYAQGSPLVFHTHWQSLFSNGTGTGLDAFEEVCRRINRTWGPHIRWTSARELADYCAAWAATGLREADEGRRLIVSAPLTCPAFTCRVPMPAGAHELSLDGVVLDRLPDGDAPLDEGTWRQHATEALICVPLRDAMELAWQ